MQKESGFTHEINIQNVLQLTEIGLQDIRPVYESHQGMMRVLTARKSGRRFILKTLRDQYKSDPVAIAALKKEYELSISVDSPCVVKVYDLTVVDPYGLTIIEEYCGGKSLQQWIDSGEKFSLEETDAIISGICRAADDIHAAGVIHRDIKPSNIIYNAKSKSIKLIDFGCADADNYEIFRGMAGTPQFIPPLSSGNVDSDSYNDYYAVGVTLRLLVPIIPDMLKEAVSHTAASLIDGRLKSGSEAYSFFQKRRERSRSHHLLGWVVLIAVMVGISIYHFRNYREPDSQTISTIASHTKESANPAITYLPEEKGESENSANTKLKDAPAEGIIPIVSDKTLSLENRNADKTPNVREDELLRNEYGVTHAEAKYVATFSSNESDRMVVNTTDEVLMELMNQYNDSNPEERSVVLANYNSFEYVYGKVMNKMAGRGSKGDSQRIAGLVKERLKLWHHTYNISE